jgi:hypothetical protein
LREFDWDGAARDDAYAHAEMRAAKTLHEYILFKCVKREQKGRVEERG